MLKDVYHIGLERLGRMYVGLYRQKKFDFDMLNTCPSAKSVVLAIYGSLRSKGKIAKIEDLDAETKAKLWQLCKPFTKGLDAEGCRQIARCYYALDYLASQMEGEK